MLNDKYVEAIDDGRIVKVSEGYAVREGLIILKRPKEIIAQNPARNVVEEERVFGIDSLRKPLKYKDNDIVSSFFKVPQSHS